VEKSGHRDKPITFKHFEHIFITLDMATSSFSSSGQCSSKYSTGRAFFVPKSEEAKITKRSDMTDIIKRYSIKAGNESLVKKQLRTIVPSYFKHTNGIPRYRWRDLSDVTKGKMTRELTKMSPRLEASEEDWAASWYLQNKGNDLRRESQRDKEKCSSEEGDRTGGSASFEGLFRS
jgi:hypothetical protein